MSRARAKQNQVWDMLVIKRAAKSVGLGSYKNINKYEWALRLKDARSDRELEALFTSLAISLEVIIQGYQ